MSGMGCAGSSKSSSKSSSTAGPPAWAGADVGDAVDPVTHDPLDPTLECLRRHRTGSARPDEAHRDHPGIGVDPHELDVATVGLQGRTDDLDRCQHLLQHVPDIQPPGGGSRGVRARSPTVGPPIRTVPAYDRLVASPPTVAAVIVAHQGGWDEILLVAGPIVIVIGLLALVKRGVEEAARRAAEHDAGSAPDN